MISKWRKTPQDHSIRKQQFLRRRRVLNEPNQGILGHLRVLALYPRHRIHWPLSRRAGHFLSLEVPVLGLV